MFLPPYFKTKKNDEYSTAGITLSIDFKTVTYNNVQDTGYFGDIAGFVAAINFTEAIDLRATFTTVGVYDIILELVDLDNESNILSTISIRFIIT